MFKMDPLILKARAKANECDVAVLEKTLRLTQILDYLCYAKPFYHNLALKGGPAINLALIDLKRLFTEMEFDFVKSDTSRQEIHQAFLDYMLTEGYYSTTNSTDTSLYSFYEFSYLSYNGIADFITIKINYLNDCHPISPLQLYKGNDLTENGLVYVLDKHELFGSMLANLVINSNHLDIYDTAKMIEAKLFDQEELELLQRCFVFSYCLNAPKNVSFDECLVTFKQGLMKLRDFDFDNTLGPLLRHHDYFDIESATNEIITFINELIDLNTHEFQFIERFASGIYDAKLVFPNKAMLEIMQDHSYANLICKKN